MKFKFCIWYGRITGMQRQSQPQQHPHPSPQTKGGLRSRKTKTCIFSSDIIKIIVGQVRVPGLTVFSNQRIQGGHIYITHKILNKICDQRLNTIFYITIYSPVSLGGKIFKEKWNNTEPSWRPSLSIHSKAVHWCEVPCPPCLPTHLSSFTHPPAGPEGCGAPASCRKIPDNWIWDWGFAPGREEFCFPTTSVGNGGSGLVVTPRWELESWVSGTTCTQAFSPVAMEVHIKNKQNPALKSRFMSNSGHLQCHKNPKNYFSKKELSQGPGHEMNCKNLMGPGSEPQSVCRSTGISLPIQAWILWTSLNIQSPTGPRRFPRIKRKSLDGEIWFRFLSLLLPEVRANQKNPDPEAKASVKDLSNWPSEDRLFPANRLNSRRRHPGLLLKCWLP